MRTTELLARYASRHDAEAFAELVREYKSMVLATCRRRLRSTADVDDAVQETFLKLARGAGTIRVNVAAWLHRCAVNVSMDLNRRAETRTRHESAAAIAPTDGRTDAQRELAALREQLDAALEAIDEGPRELILQRYFVGRSQVDLAAEAGVSPSALSQRLEKAIEALRAQLHKAGIPSVLMLGSNSELIALLEAEHASAVVSQELATSLNSIGVAGLGAAKPVGLILAACIGFLLILGVGIWLADGLGNGNAPAAHTTPTSRSTGGAGMVAGAIVDPNWQAPAELADAALFGRVTDETGMPIANATIDLNGGPSTTSDSEGRYRIRSISNEADFLASVSAEGYVPIRPFSVGPDAALRLKPNGRVQRNWVLQRGVAVKVHVIDGAGEPLESLRVECAPADMDSFARNAMSEQVSLDEVGSGTLYLPPSRKPYVVMATAAGRAPAMLRFTPESIDEPLELTVTLDEGIAVEGVALCNDGKPATGWSISARPVGWNDSSYPIPWAPIDQDGRFSIPHASAGPHHLSITIPDGNGMSHSRPIGTFAFVADGPALEVAVPMKSPGSLTTIKGTIHWIGDPRNDSVAYGVSIEAQRLDSRRDHYSTLLRGEAPAEDFTINNVEPGEYRITVSGVTFGRVTLDRVTVPGELPPIEIKVAGKPKLAGTVRDAVTRKPAANFAYRLRKLQTLGDGPNYSQSSDWVQVNDEDGKFNVDLVGPGEYQVQVSAADRAWVWSEPFRAEAQGATVALEISLTEGGTLRGVITDHARKPLAGAKVIPLSYAQSSSLVRGAVRFDGEAGAVSTNEAGVYELHHLPVGKETLKIVHPDYAPLQIADIEVVDGTTRDAPAIALTPGGRVEGVVYNHDGSVAPGVNLYFRDRSGYGGNGGQKAGTVATTTTDSDGRFAVDHLAEQTLYVSLGDDRWGQPGVLRRVVRPQEGKTATLNFGGAATVTGRIVAGAAAKANAKLALSSGDRYFGAFYAQCATDAEGRFTLRGIPPGRYVLYAEGPADRIQLRELNVANDTLDLGDVSDDRGRVTLTVHADDPKDLDTIESIDLASDEQATGWSPSFANFRREGDRWTCDDVPSGKRYASVRLKHGQLGGRLAIDRAVGQEAMSLTLRLPKRSATLRYAPATQPSQFWAQLEDADGGAWGAVAGDKPLEVKLPPGTFHFVDPMTSVKLPLPPITLREGETIEFTPPIDRLSPRNRTRIWLWTIEGAHLTDVTAALLDSSGMTVTPQIARGQEQLSYALAPGRYTLKIDQPGKPAFERSIEVPTTEKKVSEHLVNVVVP